MQISRIRTDFIRAHLHRVCLSQAAFAAKAGVSPAYLSLVLTGKRRPGPRVRRRLLDAVEEHGLGYDDLFDAVS